MGLASTHNFICVDKKISHVLPWASKYLLNQFSGLSVMTDRDTFAFIILASARDFVCVKLVIWVVYFLSNLFFFIPHIDYRI